MRPSRLIVLAALVYAVVWVLILPPVDRIQDAVRTEEVVAEVDPDLALTAADLAGEEAIPLPDGSPPGATPDGEERIRIGVPDPPVARPPAGAAGPRAGQERGPRRAAEAPRKDAPAQRAAGPPRREEAATGGLALATLEFSIEGSLEDLGPRPRVRLRPAVGGASVLERLQTWVSTVGLPRIEDLFGDQGQAVSEQGTLSMRVPASLPWILEWGPGTAEPRASVELPPLQPGEVRAQVVSVADLEQAARALREPEAARQPAREPTAQGGAAPRRGRKDPAAAATVAHLEITALGQDEERATRMWVRLSPAAGMDELRPQLLAWAREHEGALPEVFDEGHAHRKRGPLELLVPPGVPMEVTFGADGQLHGKLPILPLLPGEKRTLAVALLGVPQTDEQVASRPAEEQERPAPLAPLPMPRLQPGTDPGGTPVHSSRRGAERLGEPPAPPRQDPPRSVPPGSDA